jgi:hypothetical protein
MVKYRSCVIHINFLPPLRLIVVVCYIFVTEFCKYFFCYCEKLHVATAWEPAHNYVSNLYHTYTAMPY